MTAGVVLLPDSALFRTLRDAARDRRCVFFAGLPGVGKTLLIQQQALIAHAEGRLVHLLQWDVARTAFETPALLERYPEIDGVTHAAIRKGVGLWVRDALRHWHAAHPAPHHLLIGELPLVGNRLIELARVHDDPAEPLLADQRSLFFIPVPTIEVRTTIERSRAREMASPLHQREAANASVDVLRALWPELLRAAPALGMTTPPSESGYDPDLYVEIYRRLLHHRRTMPLAIDRVLPVSASPYELDIVASELRATPTEVNHAMQAVASWPEARLAAEVDAWFRV
jgi:hypothetical protein